MKTVRMDDYICLNVDKIIVEEMKDILSIRMSKQDAKIDRDNIAQLKRAARVILDNYTTPGRAL